MEARIITSPPRLESSSRMEMGVTILLRPEMKVFNEFFPQLVVVVAIEESEEVSI